MNTKFYYVRMTTNPDRDVQRGFSCAYGRRWGSLKDAVRDLLEERDYDKFEEIFYYGDDEPSDEKIEELAYDLPIQILDDEGGLVVLAHSGLVGYAKFASLDEALEQARETVEESMLGDMGASLDEDALLCVFEGTPVCDELGEPFAFHPTGNYWVVE